MALILDEYKGILESSYIEIQMQVKYSSDGLIQSIKYQHINGNWPGIAVSGYVGDAGWIKYFFF